jgi:anti-sigma factor RsiW
LDCSEYISRYLAAQADDELAAHERVAANEHLAQCAPCRALLAQERALKLLVRRNTPLVRTPPNVRMRIRAALGEWAEPQLEDVAAYAHRPADKRPQPAVGEAFDYRRGAAVRRGLTGLSRNWHWASAASAAAILLIALAIFSGRPADRHAPLATPDVPAFDQAIGKYVSFRRDFAPNLPAEAYSNAYGAVYAWVQNRDPLQHVNTEATDKFNDVARAYREMSMPDDLLDLSAAGYTLLGARAGRLPDGRPVAYALYNNSGNTILSVSYPDASMAAPIGATDWLGMRSFYQYKGYSICLSFYPAGHYVSILLSRLPVKRLLVDVAAADSMIASR